VLPVGLTAAVRAVLAGVVLVSLFSFFFVYPAHDPEPRGLPIAVVEGADPVAQALEQADGGDAFEVLRVRDEAQARDAIGDREAYAAIVAAEPPRLLVATAASPVVAAIMSEAAGQFGAEPQEVVPLDPDDPRGATLNVATIALTVPAILGAVALFQLAPALTPRVRLVALAAFAVLGALAALLVIKVGMGALPGPFLGLWAVITLGIFGIGTTAAGLIVRLGMPAILLSFLIFLMLGNPATGAASAPELLPEPWGTGGQLLPTGAMATGIRNVAYFDGAKLWSWLIVLLLWAAAAALLLLTARWPQASPTEHAAPPLREA
jgi:hypothetical protein